MPLTRQLPPILTVYAVFAALVLALAGCNTPAKRQAASDLSLGAFADGYRLALETKKLTDPNMIRAGREIMREWNSVNNELNAARLFGDNRNEDFWMKRLYGDGTAANPGIIARAARLALQWEAK